MERTQVKVIDPCIDTFFQLSIYLPTIIVVDLASKHTYYLYYIAVLFDILARTLTCKGGHEASLSRGLAAHLGSLDFNYLLILLP
jgi:hypothetical protein